MLTKKSRVKDLYKNPVGKDIIEKVLMQMGKSEKIITNPVVANLRIEALESLLKKNIGPTFFDTILTLLNSEQDVPVTKHERIKRAWWKEAVFYQIYPRTFTDSNGDGIGDLKGIISRLDYLKDLGVDALWLSPIYDSPMDDNGYDIRDYKAILKDFGTMEDFDELLKEVHARDMHLIMDLVVNHTSDEHEWFKKALEDKDSKYRNYYFFRDGKDTAPNNWMSFFSGSAWNHYEKEDTWALHLFSKKQMDLNWDNPEVRDDVIKMIRWWLEKGVDGFRMDVINYISKAEGLPEGDKFIGGLIGFPGVEHYFYGPNLHKYLHEIRVKAFDPFNAFSVGETPGLGMEMCKLVTEEDRKELDMVFSFDHLETPGHNRYNDYMYDLNYFKEYEIKWAKEYGSGSRMSLFYNNHDNPRMISKVNPDPKYRQALAKLLATMQFTLLGTPFVYQGDEIGLVNYDFKGIEDINDIESINIYNRLLKKYTPDEAFKIIMAGTRDHARVLMPWNENAKFKQPEDEEVRDFYKAIIAFRKEHNLIAYGEFKVLRDKKDVFTYSRKLGDEEIIVDCNLNIKEKSLYAVPKEFKTVFESDSDSKLNSYGFKIYFKK